MNKLKIRKTAVAGLFYNREKQDLENQIDNLLENAENLEITNVGGAILPHAGYLYSGSVSAEVYNIIQNEKPQTIVIFGPSHHKYFEGLAISDHDEFKTPIGNVGVNLKLANLLAENNNLIEVTDKLDINEHSIEVQLPFIKKVCPTAKIIPVLVGNLSEVDFESIVNTFTETLSTYSNILFLASTDLSHFHKYDEANLMDEKFIFHLENGDITALVEDLSNNKIEACGAICVLLVEKILQKRGQFKYKNISYKNSGDILPEHKERVVGYASGVFVEV